MKRATHCGIIDPWLELFIVQLVTTTMRKLMLIFIFMVPAVAQADGSWCLLIDEAMNCRFTSSDECYKAAGFKGGNCMPNPKQAGVTGDLAWCVVTSTMRRCTYWFQDRSCIEAARQLNGGCVPNTDKLIEKTASSVASYGFLVEQKGDYDTSAANACDGDLACEAALATGQ